MIGTLTVCTVMSISKPYKCGQTIGCVGLATPSHPPTHPRHGNLTWCISECWSLLGWTAAGWGGHRGAPGRSAGPCRSGTASLTLANRSPAHTGSRTLTGKKKSTDMTCKHIQSTFTGGGTSKAHCVCHKDNEHEKSNFLMMQLWCGQ